VFYLLSSNDVLPFSDDVPNSDESELSLGTDS
jgi:hypothetical protein